MFLLVFVWHFTYLIFCWVLLIFFQYSLCFILIYFLLIIYSSLFLLSLRIVRKRSVMLLQIIAVVTILLFRIILARDFFWRVRNRRVTEPHLVIKCSIFYLKTLCCWVSFNITKSMFTSYTIRNLKLVAITTGHQLSLSLSFLYSRKCVLLSTANQLECQLQSQIISLLFIE